MCEFTLIHATIKSSNICRTGTRHKVEERNTSGVDINLAKTGRGHPYMRLVCYMC